MGHRVGVRRVQVQLRVLGTLKLRSLYGNVQVHGCSAYLPGLLIARKQIVGVLAEFSEPFDGLSAV